jgi:hypothetical protein
MTIQNDCESALTNVRPRWVGLNNSLSEWAVTKHYRQRTSIDWRIPLSLSKYDIWRVIRQWFSYVKHSQLWHGGFRCFLPEPTSQGDCCLIHFLMCISYDTVAAWTIQWQVFAQIYSWQHQSLFCKCTLGMIDIRTSHYLRCSLSLITLCATLILSFPRYIYNIAVQIFRVWLEFDIISMLIGKIRNMIRVQKSDELMKMP